MLMGAEIRRMCMSIVIWLLPMLRMCLVLLALKCFRCVHLHSILLVSMTTIHKDIMPLLLLSLIVHRRQQYLESGKWLQYSSASDVKVPNESSSIVVYGLRNVLSYPLC